MAIGPAPLGLAYFAGLKFAGYTAYSPLLNNRISRSSCQLPSAWKSGLVRTGIGVAVGTVLGLAFWKVLPSGGWFEKHADTLFWCGLVPVRVREWYFFLWLLYRQCHLRLSQTAFAVTGGIVASFLLDAIGISTMLIVPGGAWVC
jgi:hypothetical protein